MGPPIRGPTLSTLPLPPHDGTTPLPLPPHDGTTPLPLPPHNGTYPLPLPPHSGTTPLPLLPTVAPPSSPFPLQHMVAPHLSPLPLLPMVAPHFSPSPSSTHVGTTPLPPPSLPLLPIMAPPLSPSPSSSARWHQLRKGLAKKVTARPWVLSQSRCKNFVMSFHVHQTFSFHVSQIKPISTTGSGHTLNIVYKRHFKISTTVCLLKIHDSLLVCH